MNLIWLSFSLFFMVAADVAGVASYRTRHPAYLGYALIAIYLSAHALLASTRSF